ncbi:hypothetical protein FOA52_000881 [Chlamydomonas sp. UWO 241]|nr:hypothetical protein FOA52_000881 [Chlamydomonas sp. UWO 241]
MGCEQSQHAAPVGEDAEYLTSACNGKGVNAAGQLSAVHARTLTGHASTSSTLGSSPLGAPKETQSQFVVGVARQTRRLAAGGGLRGTQSTATSSRGVLLRQSFETVQLPGEVSSADNITHIAGAKIRRRPPGHPSYSAVTLEWLARDFLARHPVIVRERMTSRQVMSHVIIPSTTRTNYCGIMTMEGGATADVVSRGREFYYVIHQWGRPFTELFQMLMQHFSPQAQHVWRPGKPVLWWSEIYIWLDLLAVNPHQPRSPAQLRTRHEVIQDAKQTLMVLDPMGGVLGRTWCLYEAWLAARRGAPYLVMLSYGVDLEPLQSAFLNMDIVYARASRAEDMHAIRAEVEAGAGAPLAMALQLKSALISGAIDLAKQTSLLSLRNIMPEAPKAADRWDVITRAALMCQIYGRFLNAEALLRQLVFAQGRMMGNDHPTTLVSRHRLASLLKSQSRFKAAEELCRVVLGVRRRYDRIPWSKLGPEDPATLSSEELLASILQSRGLLEDAQPLLAHVISGRERVLGPSQRKTLEALASMASLQRARTHRERER